MHLYPQRQTAAAKVAEELKTTTCTTPPMEERRRKKTPQILYIFFLTAAWCPCSQCCERAPKLIYLLHNNGLPARESGGDGVLGLSPLTAV